MTLRIGLIAGVVALLFACATPAAAFDAEETFKKGTFVLSGEGAYGWQFNVEQKTRVTYLEFYDIGVRFSLLPLEPLGRNHFWYGSLEMGFELGQRLEHCAAPCGGNVSGPGSAPFRAITS